MNKEKDYLTVEEVMALLQVSRRTVYRFRKQGLKCIKTGKFDFLRFRKIDVDEWIESQKTSPPP